MQPDGSVVAGVNVSGFFVDSHSGTLGCFKRGAVRFGSTGELDPTFTCNAGFEAVRADYAHVEPAPDGRLLISGLFDSIDGKPRPGYAMLRPDGRLDGSFEPWHRTTNLPPKQYLPGGVFPAALSTGGTVAVLCHSVEVTGISNLVTRMDHDAAGQTILTNVLVPEFLPLTAYRLDSSGGLIRPMNRVLQGEFSRPSGLVLTLGPLGFWARKPIDWTRDAPSERRLPFQAGEAASDLPGGRPVCDLPFSRWTEPPSAFDAAVVFRALFEEVPMELCRYAVRLPNGDVIMAVQNEPVPKGSTRLMRFDKHWRVNPGFSSRIEAATPQACLNLKLQPDGKLVIAGLIGKINGEPFDGVARLDTRGAIDPSFRCRVNNRFPLADQVPAVMDLAIQGDGRIVICGHFVEVNGTACPHIARLNADGSLDGTFRTPFLTLDQFTRERGARMGRMPVTRLTRGSELQTAAGFGETVPDGTTQTVVITSMSFQNDNATIQFTGAPHQHYILQASDSPTAENWGNINTNRASAEGVGTLRDSAASERGFRLYRVARP